jgi:cell division septation protein DedD
MENILDKKIKDKQIPEEELFEELDAMYQRVADIEKEEATEASAPGETALFLEPGAQAAPEKPVKKKPGRNKKRDYRPMILATIAILLVFILAITFWKPMAILQLLKIGETQQPAVPPPPRPRKPPSAVATPAPPPLPFAATSPTRPTPPPVAASPAPPTPSPKSLPAQTKQEAVRSPQEEAEKTKPISQEIVKPNKPLSQEKYYAVQIGSFRNMENVRDLTGLLKKEGFDAYWITMKSKKGETLYRVFVGQFTDKDEAAQFLKDKKVLRNYPGSFIQEVSSSSSSP